MKLPYDMESEDSLMLESYANTDPIHIGKGLEQCNEEQLRRVGYAALLLMRHLYVTKNFRFDNFASCIDTALTWEFG